MKIAPRLAPLCIYGLSFFCLTASANATQNDFSDSLTEAPASSSYTSFHTQGAMFVHGLGRLLTASDFYFIVGGIALAPEVFDHQFKTERPRFTEMWGASHSADAIFEAGEFFGGAYWPAALSISSYGIGKLAGKPRLAEFGADLVRTQLTNAIITVSMKAAINRPRPNGGKYSFPSGHTSSSFATATVIQSHFGWKLGVPAYALATYVGLSRLQEGKHYLTDVIAGGIVGAYVAKRIEMKSPDKAGLTVLPMSENKHYGLQLAYRF